MTRKYAPYVLRQSTFILDKSTQTDLERELLAPLCNVEATANTAKQVQYNYILILLQQRQNQDSLVNLYALQMIYILYSLVIHIYTLPM